MCPDMIPTLTAYIICSSVINVVWYTISITFHWGIDNFLSSFKGFIFICGLLGAVDIIKLIDNSTDKRLFEPKNNYEITEEQSLIPVHVSVRGPEHFG